MSPHTLGRAFALFVIAAAVAPVTAADLPATFDANRHMEVADVRPGMHGYGMTVFHGTEPEPLPFVVVSVQQGFVPGKAVVWVRCTDERMQLTGPVQGMSGSPMYVWPDGAKGEAGKGGKMLGAFAFGHSLGKDCYVGVQPIEQMLAAGARADADAKAEAAADKPGKATTTRSRDAALGAAFEIAEQLKLPTHQTWRLRTLAALSKFDTKRDAASSVQAPAGNQRFKRTPMMLPVNAGSPAVASAVSPYFRRVGLNALAGGAEGGGLAPKWLKGKDVKVKPGGVFAIPLTFGPLEMAAIGTTTEVLPDGTALAFGHSFFAQGPIRVPMAPGFVHFIQPNLQASFKLGGSLGVTGAVIRDESTAVVGKPGLDFPTVPVTVNVQWPDKGLNQKFEYKIVPHEQIMPGLIGAVIAQSINTDIELPALNTTTVNTSVKFANGRTIELTSVAPAAAAQQVPQSVVPLVATLAESDFGRTGVESVEATVVIKEGVQSANIVDISLKQSPVAPGDTLTALVRILPFRGEPILREVTIDVPKDLPEGTYSLAIGGAEMYSQIRQQVRPHLMRVTSQKQLFDAVEQMLSLKDDALYAVLQLEGGANVAIGRTELPDLPSSKLALLEVAGSTRTTRFAQTIDKTLDSPYVIANQVQLQVQVQEAQTAE